MNKWDRTLRELAKFVADWSKIQAKVGAVVVSRRGGDITVGYNGLPMGVDDTEARLQDKELKLEMIVHAEVNAIVAAGPPRVRRFTFGASQFVRGVQGRSSNLA